MIVLGIGGLLGDAASAILKDGVLVGAVEQSKLTRRVGAPEGLPDEAIRTCLDLGGVEPADVDYVAIARPLAHGPEHHRHLQIRERFPHSRIVAVEHHTAHAASAYYPSPFDEATVLSLDRGGDFRSGTKWHARGTAMHLDRELYYPDSLGDLYGRVTELLGFRSNAEEHKVQWMSLAGDERFVPLFYELVSVREREWLCFDKSYFDAARQNLGGFSSKFFKSLGIEDGAPIPASLKPHLATAIQTVVERRVMDLAGEGGNLCLAGGLGLNALLVSALERCGKYQDVFVQPAAGNAGTAVGAALYTWHNSAGQDQRISMGNLCLGPEFDSPEIKQVLENCKLRFRYVVTNTELIDLAICELTENRIVAWMHGRMEFGPRALGHRSILASPLNPYSTENLNIFIKHRESYRKFAASVPSELASQYFDVGGNARFLTTVGKIRTGYESKLQSAILTKDLIRVHLVSQEDNPLYWKLLHRAGQETGLPILYNTSFNLFGEPLVCNPRDAVRSFYASGIDSMFVGSFFLQK